MTMTAEEAMKVQRDPVKPGDVRTFYCEIYEEYKPESERLRRFTGQDVTVVGEFPTPDRDEDANPMWTVRAEDGTEFLANQEEINDWDRDLGQFVGPRGEWGSSA